MSWRPVSGGAMCRIVSMGPVEVGMSPGGGGAEAASVLEPGWGAGPAEGIAGLGGGSSIVSLWVWGGGSLGAAGGVGRSAAEAFCSAASFLLVAWVSGFASLGPGVAGASAVSSSA